MAVDRHFYIESFDAVRLSSYRVGRSPFADRYATDQTVFGMYCDRLYTLKTAPDEDPIPNYWKLRRGVMLYDVPEKPLEIAGPDAARLLDRVLACRVETLAAGRARYGIACHEDGTVLMDGVVMRLAQDRFWYVKANGEFASWLKANAIGLDAEVSDPDSRVLQIQGPKSLDVLDAAIGGGLSADFKYFHAGFFDVCGQTLWVSRTGWTGEVGIEIYCNSGPEPTDHCALWDDLLACGEPFGMEFSSSTSMGIRRIESGILDNGSDIEPDLTPFGAGLGQFVRLDKEDFIGRGALETADRSQLLFGLVCATRCAGLRHARPLRERPGRTHHYWNMVAHARHGSRLRALRSALAGRRLARQDGVAARPRRNATRGDRGHPAIRRQGQAATPRPMEQPELTAASNEALRPSSGGGAVARGIV